MSYRFFGSYGPLESTYSWLKGNHHGHSTRSDGAETPEENIRAYEEAGYDYFALSEHDLFIDPVVYHEFTKMTLLPAVEITTDRGQTLMYLGAAAPVPPAAQMSLSEVVSYVKQRGGLFIADHPNWVYRPFTKHCTVDELVSVPDIGAIEIYTGTIERFEGDPSSVDVWDWMLTKGRRVFGHATDDQHSSVDRFLGWNCVQICDGEVATAPAIIEALRNGRFYASTGVTIARIGTNANGTEIMVDSDAELIRWIVKGGTLADVTNGGKGTFKLEEILDKERISHPFKWFGTLGDVKYVRAELIGNRGGKAWTQPFFIEQEN